MTDDTRKSSAGIPAATSPHPPERGNVEGWPSNAVLLAFVKAGGRIELTDGVFLITVPHITRPEAP